jgi:type IV secretory pathway VirB2 component (pilin)
MDLGHPRARLVARGSAVIACAAAIMAAAASAQAQVGAPPVPGAPGGDLFAPLTNLFNQAALSLSGPFGLAYATAALLIAGAIIVADHRNGVRNALWVIIGSVILFFGSQIIRMIHG